MKNIGGLLLTLLFVATITSIALLYGNSYVVARLLLTSALAIWCLLLWKLIFDTREHYVMMCFVLFNIFGFTMPGIVQAASGRFPWFFLSYSTEIASRAALIVFAYTITVCVGYTMAFSKLQGSPSRRVSEFRLNAVLTLGASAALAVLAIVAVYGIGAEYFLRERSYADAVSARVIGENPVFLILLTVVRDMGFFSLALATLMFTEKRVPMPVTLLFACVGAVGFLFADNPFNVSRFNLLAFLLALIPLFFTTRRIVFKMFFVSFYFVGTIILMPILNLYSRGNVAAGIRSDYFSVYRGTVDFDGFQSVMNVVLWIDATGFKWGLQILSSILFIVPHQLWREKGTATGIAAAQFMGYPMTNISAPLPSEIYADTGLFGIIIVSILIGVAVAYLDRRLEDMDDVSYRLAKMPYALFAGYTAILVRGPLLGVIGNVAAAIVLSIILVRFCSVRASATKRGRRRNSGKMIPV